MDTIKEKKTGRLFTVLRTSSSSSTGKTYTLGGNQDTIIEIGEKEFTENFETIDPTPEYDRVWPAIKKFGSTDYRVKALFEAFLRRATEGYYNVGDFVILISLPGGLSERDNSVISYISDPVIFKISEITGLNDYYHRSSAGNKLVLSRPGYKDDSYHSFFELPMYSDKIVPGDAFYCVRRLDMPF